MVVKQLKKRTPKVKVPVRQAAPNFVTMLALAFGVSSMYFAFWGNWKFSLISVMLSAIFDGLDGRVARMLGTESKIGAQLDSLSDFVSFGVAPGFLLYQWTMNQGLRIEALTKGIKDPSAVGMPWFCVLLLAMCMAFRLARFNVMLDEKPKPYWTHFFMGLPAPAAAYVALMPIIFWFATKWDFLRSPILVSTFVIVAALFAASRIPTPCFKKAKLPEDKKYVGSLILLVCIAFAVANFWAFLSVIGVIYLITIPLGIWYFLKLKNG